MSKITVLPVDMGIAKYFVAVDEDGYPVAQGSKATCDAAARDEAGE